MKRTHILVTTALMLSVALCYSQDISESQVPSLVVNSFKQHFSKTSDVDWEMKGNEYKVEFKTGSYTDHEAWFNKTGKMVKHKQEILSSDLPNVVQTSIKNGFSGYRIDNVKRIEMNDIITYKVELESFTQEWKIIFGQDGKILEQRAD